MPRKTLDSLSEPMFYVLMALQKQPLCGADIAQWVSARTEKRIVLGPGTLYTILGKLTDEQMIRETAVDGRRRTYETTEDGDRLYDNEVARLRRCLRDAVFLSLRPSSLMGRSARGRMCSYSAIPTIRQVWSSLKKSFANG